MIKLSMFGIIIALAIGTFAGFLTNRLKIFSHTQALTHGETYGSMLKSEVNIAYKSYANRILTTPAKVSTLPRFTATQIKQFYSLNPDEWRIESVRSKGIPIRIPIRLERHENYRGYDCVPHPVFFTNQKEWHKYLLWAEEVIKQDQELHDSKIRDEATEQVIGLVQGDIDRIREERNKALQEAARLHARALVAIAMEHKEMEGTSN